MAMQLRHTDFQPTYYPPTRPNLRVVFDTTSATSAIAAALGEMPAATREATLEELAQPSLARWNEARAALTRAQDAIDGCPAEPEDAFNAANGALAKAQIALLTTPAPTQAELATKVQLFFDINAAEFCEPAIDASIQADTARLLAGGQGGTGDWATALGDLNAIRAALDAKGLSDEQVDALSSRELAAAKRLLAVPGSSVADVATKLRVWLSVVSPAGEDPAGILADLDRLGAPGSEVSADALTIGADAEALIATARHVLSPHLYDLFLEWGLAAAGRSDACDTDDILTARCDRHNEAVSAIYKAIPITFEDYAFKTWIAGVEAGDCACLGPLKPLDSFGTGIRDSIESIAKDIAVMSAIVRELDRFASKAWYLAGTTFALPNPLTAAVVAAFQAAQLVFADLPAAELSNQTNRACASSPFYRGQLLDWDAAIAAYRDAVAASAALEPDDDPDCLVGGAESDAYQRLLLLPAPHAAALAIKARLYEEVDGWNLTAAKHIARGFAADARRLAKLGAPAEADAALLAAFDTYRSLITAHGALPRTAPKAEEDALYDRMNDPEMTILQTRATTIEGVIARLRYGFEAVSAEAWVQKSTIDPTSTAFRDGLEMGDMHDRVLWGAIEDLARIAGASLTEKAA